MIQTNRAASAFVIGSINRDVVAYVRRLPCAGETVLGTRGALFPGGKGANQAVAIARLGQTCRLEGRVGADGFGNEMRAYLASTGIDISGVTEVADVATGFALITVDDASENCIVVVPGANAVWHGGLPALPIEASDIVVAQLEVPIGIVVAAFEQAKARGAQTVLNPAPYRHLPDHLLEMTDVIVLNEIELAAAVGALAVGDPADARALSRHLNDLLARGPQLAVVTLGAHGVALQARDGATVRIAPLTVASRDTTGAGDCFVGAFVAGRLAGRDVSDAARFANAAAALSVTRDGAAASFPMLADVIALLGTTAS